MIEKLEKERQEYVNKFGVEPSVNDIENDIGEKLRASLYGSKKKDGAFIIYKNTKEIKIGKLG